MNQQTDRQKQNLGYRFLKLISHVCFNTLFPVKVHGAEYANSLNAPFIIVSNHRSFIDPLLIAYKIKRYPVHYIGKKELTKTKLSKKIFDYLYMIPIDRKKTDLGAIRKSLAVLKDGILAIFPEGTRHKSGEMDDIENGASLLILKSGKPVLPVYIDNKLRLFRRTNLYYFDVLEFNDIIQKGINSNTCAECSEVIKQYYQNKISNMAKK